MENNVLQEMSVELLKLEERFRQLYRTEEKSLPDVAAAEKRVALAKRKGVKNLIGGIICAAGVLALFLLVRPRIEAYKEYARLEYGFSLTPTILSLFFWIAVLVLGGVTLVFLTKASPDVKNADLKAADIYAANKKFNEELAANKEKIKKEHEAFVEKINGEAGTKFGDASPRYFFQIPFDPGKDYQSYETGKEFYSESFYRSEWVEPFGLTCLGGPPIIHKPDKRRYIHFDGFFSAKKCTVSEALPLLEKGGYTVLFQDKEYLREHPDEEVWLQTIWDTLSMPVENQGYFKFKEIELSECHRRIARDWTEMEQFMASGIPEYESYVHVEGSSVKDERWETFQKAVPESFYGDVVDIKEGSGPFRPVNAEKTSIIEKGYLLFDGKYNRILYAALTDRPVYMRRIDFNCSVYEWKNHPRFHGWVAGVHGFGDPEMPDKASTIEFLCNGWYEKMPDFDAAAERPEGLTDGQYRLWMTDWYRASIWKKNKQQKQA